MSDLIERLRAVAETGCDPDLPYEAANEIERLRTELAQQCRIVGMSATPHLPELSAGERYIGSIGDATGAVTHLILLPGQIKANWPAAKAWAESVGGELPTRVEQALMFATAKDAFDPHWYWSGEKESPESEWAWLTCFYYGGQCLDTDDELRARAVRRVVV